MPHQNVSSGNALVSSKVIRNKPGTHYSTYATIDASAPTATYWIQLLDSVSVPANGALTPGVVFHTPRPVAHQNGVPDELTWDDGDQGVRFALGLSIVLSTTQFSKTEAGAYLTFDSEIDT